jgi:hemoglobin
MRSYQVAKRVFVPLFALALVMLWNAAPTAGQEMEQEKSLYQRLGAYDGIDAFVAELESRVQNDPILSDFFKGHSVNSLERQHQFVVEFVCEAAGGPCTYLGRDMKTVHTGLNFSDSDWEALMGHLNDTLDKFEVPQKERGEVVGFISSLKDAIVTQ